MWSLFRISFLFLLSSKAFALRIRALPDYADDPLLSFGSMSALQPIPLLGTGNNGASGGVSRGGASRGASGRGMYNPAASSYNSASSFASNDDIISDNSDAMTKPSVGTNSEGPSLEEFRTWMDNNGFGKYSERLIQEGVGGLSDMTILTEQDIKELVKDMHMGKILQRKFINKLDTLKKSGGGASQLVGQTRENIPAAQSTGPSSRELTAWMNRMKAQQQVVDDMVADVQESAANAKADIAKYFQSLVEKVRHHEDKLLKLVDTKAMIRVEELKSQLKEVKTVISAGEEAEHACQKTLALSAFQEVSACKETIRGAIQQVIQRGQSGGSGSYQHLDTPVLAMNFTLEGNDKDFHIAFQTFHVFSVLSGYVFDSHAQIEKGSLSHDRRSFQHTGSWDAWRTLTLSPALPRAGRGWVTFQLVRFVRLYRNIILGVTAPGMAVDASLGSNDRSWGFNICVPGERIYDGTCKDHDKSKIISPMDTISMMYDAEGQQLHYYKNSLLIAQIKGVVGKDLRAAVSVIHPGDTIKVLDTPFSLHGLT